MTADALAQAPLDRAGAGLPGLERRRPGLPPGRGAGLLVADRRQRPGGSRRRAATRSACPTTSWSRSCAPARTRCWPRSPRTTRPTRAGPGRPTGGTVGWVLRRQAHEALVHRVDAEQTAGLPVTDPGVVLAADGVDEMLGVMVSGLPEWASFTPDGQRVRLHATDARPGVGHGVRAVPRHVPDHRQGVRRGVRGAGRRGAVGGRGRGRHRDGRPGRRGTWSCGSGGAGARTRSRRDGDPAAVDRLRAVIVESTQ